MKNDIGSNFTLASAVVPDAHTAGAINSNSIDHSTGPSGIFFLDVGTVGASGTVDMKLQYSDDDSAWTDEPDTTAGNDTAITQITATGTATLKVPNPRARYSRVVVTVAVATCDLGVTSAIGPLRHVSAV